MASPPPYSNITGITRTDNKLTANVTAAEYDGNARPGDLVVDLTTYSLYIGNAEGNLNIVGGGGPGAPGGNTTELQYNSLGAFAGSPKLTFDNANLNVGVHIIPEANITFDLGTNANRFRDIWLANSTVHIGDGTISANVDSLLLGFGAGANVVITNAGDITAGNAIHSNYFVGSGAHLNDVPAGNIVGAVPAASSAAVANSVAGGNVSGEVSFASTANSVAVANVSGLGNIAVLNLDGNISNILHGNGFWGPELSSLNANYANYAGNAFSVTGGNVSGAVGLATYATTANSIAGSNVFGAVGLATNATSANAVAGGNVSGAVGLATFATTANAVAGANVSGEVANAAYATIAGTSNSVAGANVSGAVGLATFATTANTVAGGNVSGQVANALIAGTVYTNAQPNITSVGTLSTLDVTANVGSGNIVVTGDYFYSNGNTVLDDVINYYANINVGNVKGGNLSFANTANLGNFTISDQTLAGTVNTRSIDISPLGDGTVRVLNGIEVYQGSFTPPALFSVSNVGLVSTRVTALLSDIGAFEILGNPLGTSVKPQNPGTMLHTTGQPGTAARIYNDGVANYSAVVNRRYNGTSTSPSGVLAGQLIGRFAATPYVDNGGAGQWPQFSTARIDMVAVDTQTVAQQGTRIEMWTVAPGANTAMLNAKFDNEGIILTGNVIPNSTSEAFSLGNSTNKWSNIWLGPHTLYMEDSVTGTDIAIDAHAGALILGGAGTSYQVGNMQVTETGLNLITGPAGANLLVGTGSDTGHLQINMPGGIKFSDGNIQTTAAIPTGEKGAALGVVPLNSSSTIDAIYLPPGAVVFKGTWNATTNFPLLADGVGTAGWQYECDVAGTQDLGSGPLVFNVGDFVIYNGTIWQRIPGAGSGVTSWGVTGNIRTGAVVMTSLDVTTALASGALNNAKLANPNVEIKNGAGISGGGVIQLGGNITLIADVSDVVGGTGVTVTPTGGSHSVAIGQPVGTANSVQFQAVSATTTISATGNTSGGNITTLGVVDALGNVNGGNLTTTGIANITGNIYGGQCIIATQGLYSTGDPLSGATALVAGVPGATTSNTIAQFTGNSATYTQVAFQNLSDLGSAEFVAAADNGDDTKYHIHMGMAGSNYANGAFTIASKNDAYIYSVGSTLTGPGVAGNLVIGSTSGVVKVFTGNTATANLRTTTSSAGFAVLGAITATGGNITTDGYFKTANTWINNGITSNGNVDFSGANTSLGPIANLHITGGTGGQFMTTNGSGVVSWANVAGANITGAVNLATFAGTANAVAGGNVSGQVANANVSYFENTTAATTGTVYARFGNATSGNVAALANSVYVANVANGSFAATTFVGALSGLASSATIAASANAVAGANVSGQVANALVSGTVYTNAQANITSVGTLTGLTGNGIINFTGASNVALGSNANVHITGGSAGQVMVTNGSGNLSWTSATNIPSGAVRSTTGSTTVTFGTDSLILIYQPGASVVLTLAGYTAGATCRILVRMAGTPRTINTGVAAADNSTAGVITLPTGGGGGHNIAGNRTVQLLYTCYDGTAANCYVAATYF